MGAMCHCTVVTKTTTTSNMHGIGNGQASFAVSGQTNIGTTNVVVENNASYGASGSGGLSNKKNF